MAHPRLLPIFILLLSTTLLPSCRKSKDLPTVSAPVRVTVMEVSNNSSGESRQYSGTVSSAQTTTASFTVAGTITNLSASEGQKVTKGELLGTLDAGDYVNARNIAYAQLEEAQDAYERLKKLHDANALPEVKWVEMEQKLKQAQNAAEMADRTLGDTRLHSPATGVISRKFVSTGEAVIPVQPIYEIVSTGQLNVEVSVSENEVAHFAVGQPAEIAFNVPDITPIKGKVVSKTVVADPLTRSYTVKIDIPSENGKILPGMIANVTFGTNPSEAKDSILPDSGITLPSGSVLLNHDNRWFVWVVKNNTAQRRFVETDQLVADGIRVTSGLLPGDTVIVEGMQKVGSGSKVSPITK